MDGTGVWFEPSDLAVRPGSTEGIPTHVCFVDFDFLSLGELEALTGLLLTVLLALNHTWVTR